MRYLLVLLLFVGVGCSWKMIPVKVPTTPYEKCMARCDKSYSRCIPKGFVSPKAFKANIRYDACDTALRICEELCLEIERSHYERKINSK